MTMTTTIDFDNVCNKALEQIGTADSGKRKIRNAGDFVTPENCRALYSAILNRELIVDFKNGHGLNTRSLCIIISYVVPLMFNEAELKEYFMSAMKIVCDRTDTLHNRGVRGLYKQITGLCYYDDDRNVDRTIFSTEETRNLFLDAFNEYMAVPEHFYPSSVNDLAKDCIMRQRSLSEVYEIYSRMELADNKHPFLMYVCTILYPYFGHDVMARYFETMAQACADSRDFYQPGTLYVRELSEFIYGKAYNIQHLTGGNPRLPKYGDRDAAEEYRACFMRSVFPYTYLNHSVTRQYAFREMRLTEDEIKEYEEKYYGKPEKKMHMRQAAVAPLLERISLPDGVTYDDIKALYHEYYSRYLSERRLPERGTAFDEIKELASDRPNLLKGLTYLSHNSAYKVLLMAATEDEENFLLRRFMETNTREVMSDKDVVRLVGTARGRLGFATVDYNRMPDTPFRDEARIYLRSMIDVREVKNAVQMLTTIADFTTYAYNTFGDTKCADIKTLHVRSYVRELYSRGIAVRTIVDKTRRIEEFITSVMLCDGYEDKPVSNAASVVQFHGHDGTKNTRPLIPDDILMFLDAHIVECSPMIMLMYRILRATGWRFNEVASLTIDGIYLLDEEEYGSEYAGIRTIITKTIKQRKQHGLDEYIHDVIPMELYEVLCEYIKDTEPVRAAYQTDLIFFTDIKGQAKQLVASYFNKHANGVLEKNGMKSIDSSYQCFSSAQTRCTVATELVMANVPLTTVRDKLGHLEERTTARYYARVDKMRLADLRSDFFEKEFHGRFTDEQLALYTEDERKALYLDFALGHRQVEYGMCSKHPSEGSCASMGHFECATCPKLMTGPDYLPKWRELRDSSDAMLAEFRNTYDRYGIPEDKYQEFTEYKQEVRRNESIRAVIAEIEEWSKSHAE